MSHAPATNLRRFLVITLVLGHLAVAAAAIASPPDPFSTTAYAVPLLAAAVLLSYGLTYGGGFDYLGTVV